MATQVKISLARGAQRLKDVSVGAGTPIAGSDAIEVNIDVTRMTKMETLDLLERVKSKIFASKWPLA